MSLRTGFESLKTQAIPGPLSWLSACGLRCELLGPVPAALTVGCFYPITIHPRLSATGSPNETFLLEVVLVMVF